ncbi:hypothetical protein [Luteimonas lutimaris]|uniref:Uncharacterized protein n=1 Tax=Luteimonas lutimaris TaxID=698645 RepID=A0ABP7MTN9_9GAMM
MSISDMERMHVLEVVAEMEAIHAAMDDLMNKIGDRRAIPRDEVEQLQDELAAIRSRLDRGAKYGTVDGAKRAQSPIESAYFAGAVFQAKANLGIRVNSHPIQSGWIGRLIGASADIGMPLANLRDVLSNAES